MGELGRDFPAIVKWGENLTPNVAPAPLIRIFSPTPSTLPLRVSFFKLLININNI